MNIKNIFLICLCLTIAPYINAVTINCGNASSLLHPSYGSNLKLISAPFGDDDYPTTNFRLEAGTMISSSLLSCSSSVSGTVQTKVSLFRPFVASNISSSITRVFDGKTYHKIINSTDIHVNRYAYIHFSYSDNTQNVPEHPINTNPSPDIATSSGASQGLRILRASILFDKAPLEEIPLTRINIGTLQTTWTTTTGTYDASQVAEIRLQFTPSVARTCAVNSLNVILPTISTSALTAVNSTAGKTRFSISATCSNSLANTELNAVILDNVNVTSTNNLGVLLNNADISERASNTRIQIVRENTDSPVVMGQDFIFGTTTSGSSPTVRHNFYARYYKVTSAATGAGKVNASALLLLRYK